MRKYIIARDLNLLLLFVTVLLVFVVPFFPGPMHRFLYNATFTMVFTLSAFTIEVHRKLNIIIAVLSIGLDILSSIFDLSILRGISITTSFFFFFYIVVRFIIQIAQAKEVNIKILAESVTGYLMLSISFALIINLIMAFNPDAITFPPSDILSNDEISNSSEYLYYSLVTLSTLGYGDILPKSPISRSLLTLETVIGQFYMAIIVALLIGKYTSTKFGSGSED